MLLCPGRTPVRPVPDGPITNVRGPGGGGPVVSSNNSSSDKAPLRERATSMGRDWGAGARLGTMWMGTMWQAALGGASVIGRIRGRKRVVGRDWVDERLSVAGLAAPLRYGERDPGKDDQE
eukprot:gene14569-34835_t